MIGGRENFEYRFQSIQSVGPNVDLLPLQDRNIFFTRDYYTSTPCFTTKTTTPRHRKCLSTEKFKKLHQQPSFAQPKITAKMGKSKPKRQRNHRVDPTSKEIKPPNDPELAALREKHVLPVIKDLKSADQKTRSTAARAVANLIDDDRTRRLLLREQLVKVILEQTLTDSSLETRVDSWGILCNLTLKQEPDFVVYLYRQDLLTAIDGAAKMVG